MMLAFFCVIVNTVASLAGSYMLRPIINTYIAPTDGSRGDVAGLAKALVVLALSMQLAWQQTMLRQRLC